jgi:DNA gyrase subunit A
MAIQESFTPISITDELRTSFMDYAMSVIISRALPDVRDGLKPVHRRILTTMRDLNLTANRAHRKCAKIAGDVSGNYHPHGEGAVYPSLVRMAQNFSLRYPLIDGQGNFGSVDGDPPAAMRYTEARMTRLGEEMLRDINKSTVDYVPNYDETRQEPTVLPSAIPNLLVNGSAGIAVGMATNIPPHNLAEVIEALVLVLEHPDCTLPELIECVPGPDFPTAGFIHGRQGILEAYHTGRGFLQLRARCDVEVSDRTERECIIVSEIPYQLNKTRLLERIAEMVRAKKIEGIADLRDESDRRGMRIVIDLKRDAVSQVVLNQLYANTQLQSTFGIIMLALVDNEPRVLTLKEMLIYFLEHRREVIIRRTQHDLERAREREHVLVGLLIALDHLDAVIELIRNAASPDEARQGLMEGRFGLLETEAGIAGSIFREVADEEALPTLSAIQAQAILDLRLQRLTGLERDKILTEHTELREIIQDYEDILANDARLQGIIKDDLLALKEQYGDARRTEIVDAEEEIHFEDLIVEEDMVVTKSHTGYIKRQPVNLYQNQHRGGKGKMAMQTREEDFVEQLFIASTHDYLLFFTNIGKVHWLKVYQLPLASRIAKGKAVVNLLQLQPDERISTVVPIRRFEIDRYLIMATKFGVVKKTSLKAYSNPRQAGIIALNLDDGDELIRVGVTQGDQDILLGTRKGKAIRFNESDARAIGRTARGVKGLRLAKDDEVVGMEVLSPDSTILTVSESGYGKRTTESEYRTQSRGGKGLINLRITAKTGPVMGILQVFDDDDVMVMSDQGNLVRLPVGDIRPTGRNTQGVRLINLRADQRLVGAVRIEEDGEDDIDETDDTGEGSPLLPGSSNGASA